MTRGLTPDVISSVTSKQVQPVYMVKVDTASGPIYAWTGYGNITWNGMTFLGTGNQGAISLIAESTDLTASGIQLTLNGAAPENLSLALNSIEQGKTAQVWLGFLSGTSLVTDPYLFFSGFTDVPEIDESPTTVSISISAENYLSNLGRALGRRYTTEDQQLDDPTDLGFEYVPGLQDAVISFGGS